MSTSKIVTDSLHSHINSKETDLASKKDNSSKKENSSNTPTVKKPNSINQSHLKESISSPTDNMNSIIINLSQLENQNFSKKCETNENLNNISDLIKAKKTILASPFQYITKPNEEDYFVYNKIVKNESMQDNKRTAGQWTTNLDNGFINETSSKNSNKEVSIKQTNSFINNKCKLNQKIENMKSMNYRQYNEASHYERESSSQVKFSCCSTSKK